jgi:hypothetical protein
MRSSDSIDDIVSGQLSVMRQAQFEAAPEVPLLLAPQQGSASKHDPVARSEIRPELVLAHGGTTKDLERFQGNGAKVRETLTATAIPTDNGSDHISSVTSDSRGQSSSAVEESVGSSARLMADPDRRSFSQQAVLLSSPKEEIVVRAKRVIKVRTITDLERGARGNTVLIPLPKDS